MEISQKFVAFSEYMNFRIMTDILVLHEINGKMYKFEVIQSCFCLFFQRGNQKTCHDPKKPLPLLVLSGLYYCFVHPIFSSCEFWYFGNFSCVIFFQFFFPFCPSCLAKCKQRLHNIFVFS